MNGKLKLTIFIAISITTIGTTPKASVAISPEPTSKDLKEVSQTFEYLPEEERRPFAGASATASYDPADFSQFLFYASLTLAAAFLCSIAESFVRRNKQPHIEELLRTRRINSNNARLLTNACQNADRALTAARFVNATGLVLGTFGASAWATRYWGDESARYVAVSLFLLVIASRFGPIPSVLLRWPAASIAVAWLLKLIRLLCYPFTVVFETQERLTALPEEY